MTVIVIVGSTQPRETKQAVVRWYLTQWKRREGGRGRARAFPSEGHQEGEVGSRQTKRYSKSQWRSTAGRGKEQVKG